MKVPKRTHPKSCECFCCEMRKWVEFLHLKVNHLETSISMYKSLSENLFDKPIKHKLQRMIDKKTIDVFNDFHERLKPTEDIKKCLHCEEYKAIKAASGDVVMGHCPHGSCAPFEGGLPHAWGNDDACEKFVLRAEEHCQNCGYPLPKKCDPSGITECQFCSDQDTCEMWNYKPKQEKGAPFDEPVTYKRPEQEEEGEPCISCRSRCLEAGKPSPKMFQCKGYTE